jgi:hypothetical protein
MPRAKIWFDDVEHFDNRSHWADLAVGKDLDVGVKNGGGGRLYVTEMWPGAHTTIHGRFTPPTRDHIPDYESG